MKVRNNYQGNVTLIACLVLLSTSFWVTRFLQAQLNENRELQKHFQALLCAKEYNGRLKDITYKVETGNKVIRWANAAMIAGVQNPLIVKAAYQTKKWTQRHQTFSIFSYLKKLADLNANNCFFHPKSYKTPFKFKGLELKRSIYGTTIIRRTEWNDYIYSNKRLFQTKVKLHSDQAKLKTRLMIKDLPWSKL